MLTWHSFLQSVMFFVRSISVKLTKKHYRSSSVLMSGAVVIAVVAFSANGFGGGGKNAMAAPRTVDSLEADEEPETEALFEGSSFVTEAKIQFGLLNTGSEGQHLAGALLERDVRNRQRRQADAQIEIEALQKQILKEKEEAEARRKAEEERRAARRIKVSDEDYQVLLRIVQAEAGVCDEKGKILVADVIINRVLSGKFPGSVKGVVYQGSQFQPVSNGTIYDAPASSSLVAAKLCLEGTDVVGESLYFFSPALSAGRWIVSNATYYTTIGGHQFYV
mgnify:CR=1 FL=1